MATTTLATSDITLRDWSYLQQLDGKSLILSHKLHLLDAAHWQARKVASIGLPDMQAHYAAKEHDAYYAAAKVAAELERRLS